MINLKAGGGGRDKKVRLIVKIWQHMYLPLYQYMIRDLPWNKQYQIVGDIATSRARKEIVCQTQVQVILGQLPDGILKKNVATTTFITSFLTTKWSCGNDE